MHTVRSKNKFFSRVIALVLLFSISNPAVGDEHPLDFVPELQDAASAMVASVKDMAVYFGQQSAYVASAVSKECVAAYQSLSTQPVLSTKSAQTTTEVTSAQNLPAIQLDQGAAVAKSPVSVIEESAHAVSPVISVEPKETAKVEEVSSTVDNNSNDEDSEQLPDFFATTVKLDAHEAAATPTEPELTSVQDSVQCELAGLMLSAKDGNISKAPFNWGKWTGKDLIASSIGKLSHEPKEVVLDADEKARSTVEKAVIDFVGKTIRDTVQKPASVVKSIDDEVAAMQQKNLANYSPKVQEIAVAKASTPQVADVPAVATAQATNVPAVSIAQAANMPATVSASNESFDISWLYATGGIIVASLVAYKAYLYIQKRMMIPQKLVASIVGSTDIAVLRRAYAYIIDVTGVTVFKDSKPMLAAEQVDKIMALIEEMKSAQRRKIMIAVLLHKFDMSASDKKRLIKTVQELV